MIKHIAINLTNKKIVGISYLYEEVTQPNMFVVADDFECALGQVFDVETGLVSDYLPTDAEKSVVEREWRNGELSTAAKLKSEPHHPYIAEIESYLQLLRDYPDTDGFPNGERPTRPTTQKGTIVF